MGGSTVTFAGTMSDVDIDANLLAVTWTSDKDGELSTGMADVSGTYYLKAVTCPQHPSNHHDCHR